MIDILINKEIGYWGITADDIRKQIPEGKATIRLLINSPGGDCFEAFEIYNLLKEYPGKVIGEITGLAASAAAYLALSADEIHVRKNSSLMFHRSWSVTIGNSVDHSKYAEVLDGIDNIISDDFSKLTGKGKKETLEEFTNEIWLIGSEKIKAAGIPVTVIDEESPEVPEAIVKEKVKSMIEKIKASSKNLSIKNKIEEEKMDFDEFIKANPGEESAVLAYAKTKAPAEDIDAKIKSAVEEERKRISDLLELGGVNQKKEIADAVTSGKNPGDFAQEELRRANAAVETSFSNSIPAPKLPADSEKSGSKQASEAEYISAIKGGA